MYSGLGLGIAFGILIFVLMYFLGQINHKLQIIINYLEEFYKKDK